MQYIANAYDEAIRIAKAVLGIEQEEEYNEVDRDELPIELQATIEEGINEGQEGNGMPHEEMIERMPNSKARKIQAVPGHRPPIATVPTHLPLEVVTETKYKPGRASGCAINNGALVVPSHR